ncbi:hypothetical protein MY9_0080 [Bacillus sp. JS]|nr:hypothetical protein MY9_0080 [Bacillus sp. JS]
MEDTALFKFLVFLQKNYCTIIYKVVYYYSLPLNKAITKKELQKKLLTSLSQRVIIIKSLERSEQNDL